MSKRDFTNQVFTPEHIKIARALWEHYIERRGMGEQENKKGLMKESGETYMRFLKSIMESTVVKFENIFLDDELQNGIVYHVIWEVTWPVAVIVNDHLGSGECYLHNHGDEELNEYLLANF